MSLNIYMHLGWIPRSGAKWVKKPCLSSVLCVASVLHSQTVEMGGWGELALFVFLCIFYWMPRPVLATSYWSTNGCIGGMRVRHCTLDLNGRATWLTLMADAQVLWWKPGDSPHGKGLVSERGWRLACHVIGVCLWDQGYFQLSCRIYLKSKEHLHSRGLKDLLQIAGNF